MEERNRDLIEGFRLSPQQVRLWMLEQESPVYRAQCTLTLEGNLNKQALKEALQVVVTAHQILRTNFYDLPGMKTPIQVVADGRKPLWREVDLSRCNSWDHEDKIDAYSREDADLAFDLQAGPLLRSTLLALSADKHILLLSLPSLCADARTLTNLADEISQAYAARTWVDRNSDDVTQYVQFSEWQNELLEEGGTDAEEPSWRKVESDAYLRLKLPFERRQSRPHKFEPRRISVTIGPEMAAKMCRLSEENGATVDDFALACWCILLWRLTGESDIVVGALCDGRKYEELEKALGLFAKFLPAHCHLENHLNFVQVLELIHHLTGELYRSQESFVWELFSKNSGGIRETPFFPFGFSYCERAANYNAGEVTFSIYRQYCCIDRFKVELSCTRVDHSNLNVELLYDANIFRVEDIERLGREFQVLVQSVIGNPEGPIDELNILSEDERSELLTLFSNTKSAGVAHLCIHQLIEEQAERLPDKVAIVFEDEQLSYGELNARANKLAYCLQRSGVGPERVVAICVDRSPDMLVGMLGVLKAGGAYLPLDPAQPRQRLAYIIEDTGAAALVTQKRLVEKLPNNQARVICLDSDWEAIALESEENLASGVRPENLLYVIYTSGSTGRPKGVGVEHRQLLNYLAGIQERLALPAEASFALASTFAADLGNTAIFPSLCYGGSLHILSQERASDPRAMADYFRRHHIDCLKIVPSHIAALASNTDPASIMPRQRLILGGETCGWDLVAKLQAHVSILNHYGPTEATVGVLTYAVESDPNDPPAESVPLGRPINNAQTYLLDPRLELVPLWARGELHIGGASVARGYLRCPDGTAEKFTPDPFGDGPGARLYKTGDLARYRADGQIEFLGRADHQVKLRGYRIEPAEIETTLKQHPGIQESVVMVREDTPGVRRLVAYVVPVREKAFNRNDLWEFLRDRLPGYMVPSALVVLNALPLTRNGKIDRQALPTTECAESESYRAFQSPRTPTEEVLADIWAQLLRTERIGVYDNFFELGGHSLLAAQLMARIRQVFKVEMPLKQLFESPTVAGIVERIESLMRAGRLSEPPLIEPAPRSSPLPLSFTQQRLWFVDQLVPGTPVYNVPKVVPLNGELALTALEQALSEVMRRHEVLRTRFVSQDGGPVQVIDPARQVTIPIVDLSALIQTQRQVQARRLVGEEAERPFDLSRGPVIRVSLLRLCDGDHLALLTMHHITCDAWSSRVLNQEMTELCDAYRRARPSTLRELPIQFADFALWQRNWLQGAVLDEQLQYWKTQLNGSPPLLELPTDRPRPPVQTFRAGTQRLVLTEDLTRGLVALSRQEAATLFMTLLAGFQVLLGRHSGHDDIVVGVPTAGRNRIDVENLIGFFINTLAVRTDLKRSPGFRHLLRRVREVALEAYTHQDLPFEKLVEELEPDRSLSHSPLFQAVFMFDNNAVADSLAEGSAKSGWNGAVTESWSAKFDLTLTMAEVGQQLLATLKYSTDLFDSIRIGRMLRHFQKLLEGVVADPDQNVWDLPLLAEAERQHLLLEWNDTRTDQPEDLCLPALFHAQAKRQPEMVAVVFEDQHITYGELNRRACQLAQHLQSLGIGPEQVVGLFVQRCPEMVIGVLGIHMAGAGYVPLDPAYPQERLAFMWADTRASLLLTQQVLLDELPTDEATTICLDSDWNIISREAADPPNVDLRPENPAYVIYTSGSTGRPKGAVISHRGICNRMLWGQSLCQLTETDRVLYETSFSFDFSVWETYGPLMAGAKLVMARPGGQEDPSYLTRLMAEQGMTVVHFVPSMLQLLIEEMHQETCRDLRLVFCGGEALPEQLKERFFARLESCLYNQYGATEASINSTYQLCEAGSSEGVVPIGRPVHNTEIYLLDARWQPVPIGISGEVHIGGVGLAREYLNRPELTAEKFIPNPFNCQPGRRLYKTGDLACYRADGVIEFLGRKDYQVKVRGFRIELGEIEAMLLQDPAVREAVAMVREDRPGDKRLVAYVVSDQGQAVDSSYLKGFLRERLPEHMIPASFVTLASMPLTPNGKLDREALPAPDQLRLDPDSDYATPRTPAEELLINIWSQVLGIEKVGIYDNFFDLGGHSLLAAQVMSRVRGRFKVEISLRRLFESPTVAGLAAVIEDARRDGQTLSAPPIEPVVRCGPLPLSFAQQRLWFLDQLTPNQATYNMRNVVRLMGSLSVAVLQQSLSEVTRRHEVLRTRYVTGEGEPAQLIDPAEPLALPIVDLTGLDDVCRQIEIRRLAEKETQRPFNLTLGPMLRSSLIGLSDQGHALLLTIHHIASDAWSMMLLRREVTVLYDAFSRGVVSPLAELPIQYADYAAWQRQWLTGEVLDEQVRYWKEHLEGSAQALELPLDHPRPAIQSFRGSHQTITLTEQLTATLKALSRKEEVTLFMLLLAAFKALLSRYTGQDDIVLGAPIAGRNRAENEGLIGFFINTLVLRTDLSGDPSFRELLGRVREVMLGAYTHQDLPFEKLVEELDPQRSLSRTPLFQVFFNMINMPEPLESKGTVSGGSNAEWVLEAESKFDLTLYVLDRKEGIHLQLVYNADLFEPARMAQMLDQFNYLLSQIVQNPEQSIASFSLVTSAVEVVLPEPGEPLDSAWGGAVHDRFSWQASRVPGRTAIVDSKDVWTYRELEARSNQLANYLRSSGIETGAVVAVYADRCASLLWALLGVLKAGGGFLILDSAYPAARLIDCLRRARPRAWLQIEMEREMPGALKDFVATLSCSCRLTLPPRRIAESCDFLADYSEDSPRVAVRPDDVAYLAVTSGSTGAPKVVIGEHRPLSHFLQWHAETFDLGDKDRFSMLSGLSHDPLLRDVFAPLWVGATLCIPDQEDFGSPGALVEWMHRERVSIAHITPATGQLLTSGTREDETVSDKLTDLRHAFFSGDLLTSRDVSNLRLLAPSNITVNFYGTTETPQAMAYFVVPHEAEVSNRTVPLGRGIKDVQLLIVNSSQRLAGVGELGEICVRSPHLARGYLGDDALTQERFIISPFTKRQDDRLYRTGDLGRYLPDGNVEFVGRRDRQVTIRGFRIELEEVETTLRQHPNVGEAVIVTREDESGDKRLVAYVVAERSLSEALSPGELRRFLKERLPDYMTPSAFVTLDELPLTPNGKVDHRALPTLDQARPAGAEEYMAPRSPVEEALLEIWNECLRLDRIGINENFFELGGHSLLATQVMSRVRQVFQVEVPLSQLFEAPTVAGLAERIEAALRSGAQPAPPILPATRDQALPLSFAHRRLWFIDQMAPGNTAYNIRKALQMTGPLSPGALEQSLGEVVRRHETLRTRFVIRGGDPIQVIDPAEHHMFVMIDLSGLSDAERRSKTVQLAEQEAKRPFDLARGPLVRSGLLRLAEMDHVILLTMHHIVSDGWSSELLRRELTLLYEAYHTGSASPLPELPIQYADYAVWQRQVLQGEVLEAQLAYWKQQLRGIRPLELPTDYPRPKVQTFRGTKQFLVLSEDLSVALRLLSRRMGVTLFMTLLTGFKILLYRYSGQEDIVVGTGIANRNRAEIEGLIGFFVNMLVLRTDLAGNPTFGQMLKRVQNVTLGAYAHQDMPFEKLVEALQEKWDLSHTPMFQVTFFLQSISATDIGLSNLTQTPLPVSIATTHFDLSLFMLDTARGLIAALEYNTDLFSSDTITRMLDHLRIVLQHLAMEPGHRLLDVQLQSESNTEASGVSSILDTTYAAEQFDL